MNTIQMKQDKNWTIISKTTNLKSDKKRSKKQKVSMNYLFGGELRGVGKDEVDGELGGDRRCGGRAWGHEGERGLGGIDIGDHFLPRLSEHLVRRRSRRHVGGERPSGGGGSRQNAGGDLAEHGCCRGIARLAGSESLSLARALFVLSP